MVSWNIPRPTDQDSPGNSRTARYASKPEHLTISISPKESSAIERD